LHCPINPAVCTTAGRLTAFAFPPNVQYEVLEQIVNAPFKSKLT
jgi:hypothetical protein